MSDATNKTWLQKLGSDVKGFFSFLGSDKGKNIIATGEAVVESFVPGTEGFITLLNKWGVQIIQSEALATAAGSQTGSGPQKAALVLSAVTPDALAFAKANGLPTPTAEKLAAANKALVDFANAFAA